MLLHKGNAAKEVAQQRKDRRPGNATQHIKDDKVAPVHAAHAGDKGHKGADKREEATQEDGQVTPLVQEILGLFDALGRHGLYLARGDDLAAKEVADHKVALIAQDGCGPCGGQKRHDVKAAVVGKEARGKQQRIARKEREEHHARLDKDDQEHAAVGHKRAGGDPAGNRGARVFEQLGDKIDETHEVKPLSCGRGYVQVDQYTVAAPPRAQPHKRMTPLPASLHN